MKRLLPTMLGSTLALALTFGPGEAQAQFGYGRYPGGYGGYGWGGWGGAGSTAQGSIAQGLGMFNMGAGMYNEATAQANSINADTMMRWNDWMYRAQRQATHEYYLRRDAHLAKNREAYDAFLTKLKENPSPRDIEQGDALNAILDQLSDPRIQPSTLRGISAPIDAKVIREVPFNKASEAITISLDQLKDGTKWPRVLRDARFASEQKDFEALVTQARKEDAEGEIDPATLIKTRAVAKRISDKLKETPLDDKEETQEAQSFVKTLIALTRMLEKPQVEEVLDELKKLDKTSVGNLLGFMRTFNLRFGAATTPKQRMAYAELYPEMDRVRDKVVSQAQLDDSDTATAKDAKIHDFFSAMEMDDIEGKKHDPKNVKPIKQP